MAKKIDWMRELRQAALLIFAVLFVHSAIAKPFYIPSESMLPSLMVGDRLVVSKYPYGYSYLSPSVRILPPIKGRLFGRLPERGDIVVLKSPIEHQDYIKRVVGLPGDMVQMRGGILYLNGKAVSHRPLAPVDIAVSPNTDCEFAFRAVRDDGTPVCRYPRFRETLPGGRSYDTIDLGRRPLDDTPPTLVPAGHVFLLGDNRDNSADSRVPPEIGGLGLVPVENILGRAEFITFSLDGSTRIFDPRSWVTALRPDRAWTTLHPERPAR